MTPETDMWAAMPDDLWVVLRADGQKVEVTYRPSLTLPELEAAGKWARARAEAFDRFQVAGLASDGFEWLYDQGHGVYMLFGREKVNIK